MTPEQHQRLDCLVATAVFSQHVFVFPSENIGGMAYPDVAYITNGNTTPVPSYSQSLDALLPALSRFYLVEARHSANGRVYVLLRRPEPQGARYKACAATLPLALCVALLLAHGVDVRESVE